MEDPLWVTYTAVVDAVDRGVIVDMIYFEVSKAFDVVSHSIILEKLQRLGVCSKFLV